MSATVASFDEIEVSKIEAWVAIGAPLCAVTFGECLHLFLHQNWFKGIAAGPRLILIAPYFLVSLPLLVAVSMGVRKGRVGSLAALVGSFIAYFAMTRYRGSHQWPTLFDWQGTTPTHLYLPIMIGVAGGAIVGFLMRNKPISSWLLTSVIVLMLITVGWSWADAYRDIGLYSLFPYSRHLAVTVCLLVYALVVALSGIVFRE
jgi:hypothetical protein